MDEPVSLTINKISRLSKRITDRLLLPYGLRTSEIRFLGYMAEHGAVSHKDLQNVFRMTRATVSQLVGNLKAAGLINMEESPSDRRQYVLTLSDKGTAVFGEAIRNIREIDRKVASAFSPEELSAFSEIADKLIRLYEEELCLGY